MVEGDLMEDGGRRWTLRLRENLWFHDRERVRSRDCIASLRRWMVRDQGGVTLSERIDAIEAPDDRTIVLRLNKPFPHLRTLLSKFIIPAVMMPERLAQTDPFKQIPEAIGSGPFAGWRTNMCWAATPPSRSSTATCRATNRQAIPRAVIACWWIGSSGR
jgi:peptide/nickel transport system substrate-binding protein